MVDKDKRAPNAPRTAEDDRKDLQSPHSTRLRQAMENVIVEFQAMALGLEILMQKSFKEAKLHFKLVTSKIKGHESVQMPEAVNDIFASPKVIKELAQMITPEQPAFFKEFSELYIRQEAEFYQVVEKALDQDLQAAIANKNTPAHVKQVARVMQQNKQKILQHIRAGSVQPASGASKAAARPIPLNTHLDNFVALMQAQATAKSQLPTPRPAPARKKHPKEDDMKSLLRTIPKMRRLRLLEGIASCFQEDTTQGFTDEACANARTGFNIVYRTINPCLARQQQEVEDLVAEVPNIIHLCEQPVLEQMQTLLLQVNIRLDKGNALLSGPSAGGTPQPTTPRV